MIKGCRKNVVYIKDTGSEMFREAFFILSDAEKSRALTETDMLREARRLIAETPEEGKGERPMLGIAKALWFVLGAAVTTALNTAIYYII